MKLKIMGVLTLSALLVSFSVWAAGARLMTHKCIFNIPRSQGEIFYGYGRTKLEARTNVIAACKEYHDRYLPGHCERYVELDDQEPTRFMLCRPNVGIGY